MNTLLFLMPRAEQLYSSCVDCSSHTFLFSKMLTDDGRKEENSSSFLKPSPARCVPSGCYTSIHLFAGGGGGRGGLF
jgi:hypothetical protein